ncbi:hypothetical protein BGZ70_004535 [Mortierella alpina]|uniref:FHA domain-containing protein n=1 Tax=Mortierella alpina TaxID=64518 RepID=A0A9P6JE96_MORAP|nr:hypothetical protein BGZ70_004535 [Mortierella alpina]
MTTIRHTHTHTFIALFPLFYLVKVDSNGAEITVTRLGTNRSLLNGKDLPKGLPVPIKNRDILTLLELQHPITIEVHSPEQAVDKSAISAGPSSSKHPARSNNVEGLRDALFALPIQPAQQVTPPVAPQKEQVQEQLQRMDMDDSPENTSDSEPDDKDDQRLENTSDISAESSLICEDLSDLEESSGGTAA